MDKSAIENCSDEILVDMGLTKVGDRLALRGFCNQESNDKKTAKTWPTGSISEHT